MKRKVKPSAIRGVNNITPQDINVRCLSCDHEEKYKFNTVRELLLNSLLAYLKVFIKKIALLLNQRGGNKKHLRCKLCSSRDYDIQIDKKFIGYNIDIKNLILTIDLLLDHYNWEQHNKKALINTKYLLTLESIENSDRTPIYAFITKHFVILSKDRKKKDIARPIFLQGGAPGLKK